MQPLRWIAALLAFALVAPGNGRAAGGLTLDAVFAATPPWGAIPTRIVWSPDGSRFTYSLASQDPRAAATLYLYDARSRKTTTLLQPVRFGKNAPSPVNTGWSPDGRHLAVTVKGTLSVFALDGGALRKLADDASDVRWSPNGNQLAFARGGNVWVVPADGTSPHRGRRRRRRGA